MRQRLRRIPDKQQNHTTNPNVSCCVYVCVHISNIRLFSVADRFPIPIKFYCLPSTICLLEFLILEACLSHCVTFSQLKSWHSSDIIASHCETSTKQPSVGEENRTRNRTKKKTNKTFHTFDEMMMMISKYCAAHTSYILNIYYYTYAWTAIRRETCSTQS